MWEQTTPSPLALEVNEIPNLVLDLLLTKPKARSGSSCRVEFDIKKVKKNTKISR